MSQDIEARAKLTDEKRKEQFQDLKQYLDEEVPDSVTEKTGNSAVTRLAIKMAHEKMQELQEERELKAKEFQKLQKEMKELAENV
ncbi:hypothetical protein HRED_05124 [Candidatus Haloredivivus sp. G17]|nr:hypothetical protein HRED_03649 [Candidatus Haloredivivus sp. G17]EHK02225.1 hypothetical protein HRED_05124 [Candidatus Haloredivivus sp. G17]